VGGFFERSFCDFSPIIAKNTQKTALKLIFQKLRMNSQRYFTTAGLDKSTDFGI
jgi:hypothetical protein